MNAEMVVLNDECERKATWTAKYHLQSIPLADAMHRSLRAGLISGDGSKARETMLALAAEGLDIQAPNVYDIAVHHAAMMEVIASYLTAEGPWTPELDSYLMRDGRLRRVVLCSTWSALREKEERHSWRTVVDSAITNRPMLINVIVIGQSIKGFRPTPWTRGHIHPENGLLRIKRIASEKTGPNPKFTDNWKKVFREETDHKSLEWLGFMQKDRAFDDLVKTVNCDVPANRQEILDELGRMKFGGTAMRRSACFRLAPCSFARVCHSGESLAGWREK